MEGNDRRSKYGVDRCRKKEGHRTKGLACGSAATNKFFGLKGVVNLLFRNQQVKPYQNAYQRNSSALKYKEVGGRNGHYRVSLRATVEKEDEYEAVVQISGFCEVDEHSNEKDTLLEQNSVAILFAYVRSELTLITAQPETDPIVLPVVNIASMMQKRKM